MKIITILTIHYLRVHQSNKLCHHSKKSNKKAPYKFKVDSLKMSKDIFMSKTIQPIYKKLNSLY